MIESFAQMAPLLEDVSPSQLKELERYLDNLFAEIDIDVEFSKHFKERVNDKRNKDEPIMVGQLRRAFRENFRAHKKELQALHDKDDAHFLKISDRLNIPFTIQKDKNGELDLVAKSAIRRKEDWVKRGKPKDGGKVFDVK